MSRVITRVCIFALTLIALTLLATTAMQAQATLAISLALGADSNGEPTYTATVTNTSNLDAPNLTVTYTLPAAELPISPSPSGGCLFTPGSVHLTVVCSIANLNPSQSHAPGLHVRLRREHAGPGQHRLAGLDGRDRLRETFVRDVQEVDVRLASQQLRQQMRRASRSERRVGNLAGARAGNRDHLREVACAERWVRHQQLVERRDLRDRREIA